jgi:hypothetical protein
MDPLSIAAILGIVYVGRQISNQATDVPVEVDVDVRQPKEIEE